MRQRGISWKTSSHLLRANVGCPRKSWLASDSLRHVHDRAAGLRQFGVGLTKAVCQHAYYLNRHFREFGQQIQEVLLVDAQDIESGAGSDRRCTIDVTKNGDLADDRVGSDGGNLYFALIGSHQYVCCSRQDHIGGIAVIALMK